MEFLKASLSLVPSAAIRNRVEGSPAEALFETSLVCALAAWHPSPLISVPLSMIAFLSWEFWQTRKEMASPHLNVRESQTTTSSSGGVGPGDDSCPYFPESADPHTPGNSKSTVALPDGKPDETDGKSLEDLHGRPFLFPTRLIHTRMTPFKNKFSHSYVLAGVPVGLQRCYSPIFSVDYDGIKAQRWYWPFRRAWFNVRAQDHGIRGGTNLSLSHKLREILLSEGADPSEFAYAFMITVPSVNGHLNNPLGFWLLYDAKRVLTAVIPELNTSFDERRTWLVRRADDSPPASSKSWNFKGHFLKDLHVSPFNPSTGGSYTVDVMDPLSSENSQLAILITLKRADGKVLMLGRIETQGTPLDASEASMFSKLLFLARWWWVALGTTTYGRILTEAGKIYFRFNPRTWRHPELGNKALGRPARGVEKTLERHFRQMLKDQVENYPCPLTVIYKNPGEHSLREEKFTSPSTATSKDSSLAQPKSAAPLSLPSEMTFQVLTPSFYHRFFHYQSASSALMSELLDNEELSHTAWSSHPSQFISFLSHSTTNTKEPVAPASHARQLGLFQHLQWKTTAFLRPRVPELNYARKQRVLGFSGLSSMDLHVLEKRTPQGAQEYRRALLQVYLGERIGSNWEVIGLSTDAVLRIYDAMVKVVLLELSAWAVISLIDNTSIGGTTFGSVGLTVLGATALNTWAIFKALM